MTKTIKHLRTCNETRHAQRDQAFGYKSLCDGNRACESCEKHIAYRLDLASGRTAYVCDFCYEAGKFTAGR